jgi:hypothetical protein
VFTEGNIGRNRLIELDGDLSNTVRNLKRHVLPGPILHAHLLDSAIRAQRLTHDLGVNFDRDVVNTHEACTQAVGVPNHNTGRAAVTVTKHKHAVLTAN